MASNDGSRSRSGGQRGKSLNQITNQKKRLIENLRNEQRIAQIRGEEERIQLLGRRIALVTSTAARYRQNIMRSSLAQQEAERNVRNAQRRSGQSGLAEAQRVRTARKNIKYARSTYMNGNYTTRAGGVGQFRPRGARQTYQRQANRYRYQTRGGVTPNPRGGQYRRSTVS